MYAEGILLNQHFRELVSREEVAWEVKYRLLRRLGSGGQGIVYLADRGGAFGVTFRLALKFFRPDRYQSVDEYRNDMSRLARLAMKLSRLQQDHLHDVYNVVESKGIMIQAMEWVDGYDLRRLLTPQTLEQTRGLCERCDRHADIRTAAIEARDRDLDDPGMSARCRCIAP